MKQKTRVAAAAVAILSFVMAGPAFGDQWSGYLTPVGAHVEDDNNAQYLYIVTSQPVLNPAGCPATDGYEVGDQVIVNSAFATVLAALAMGEQISVYVSSTVCVHNRPAVEAVQIGQQ